MASGLAGPFAQPHAARTAKPALVRPRPLVRHEAIVSSGGRAVRAALGRSGIASLKREGDGATPRGRMMAVAALVRRRVPLAVPSRPARRSDGWCDAAASQRYNRAVRLPFAPSHKTLAPSHETMMRDDALYDVVVVTDHNQSPRVRGAGSAIFLHVARPARGGVAPTAGCIAFGWDDWRRGAVPLGAYLVGVEGRPL